MHNRILNFYNNKDYEAIVKIIDDENKDVSALEIKAISLIHLNKFNEAKSLYKKIIITNDSSSNRYNLGVCYLNLSKIKKAISNFKISSLDMKFNNPALLNIAHCYKVQKKYFEAEKCLFKIIRSNRNILQAQLSLMALYQESEQYNELKKYLKSTESKIGKHEEWIKRYLYVLYSEKKYLETIHRIKKLNTSSKEISVLEATCFMMLSKFYKAIKLYKQLTLKYPNDFNCWYNLSAAYSNLTSNEELNKGLENSINCIKINSEYDPIYFVRSIIFEKMNDLDNAYKEIIKALQFKSEKIKYLYKLSEIQDKRGEFKNALKILELIIKKDKGYNLAIRLKGIINLKLKKYKESEKLLKLAVSLDNTDQRAIAHLTLSKLALNKVEQVKEFSEVGTIVKVYKIKNIQGYDSIKEFNIDISNDIKKHSLLRKEPNGLAAKNGFLTDNLFEDKTNSIKLFKKLLLKKINEYIDGLIYDNNHYMLRHISKDFKVSSWATWVKGDGFIDKHIHEESWISGVYYSSLPNIINDSKSYKGYLEFGCIPNELSLMIEKKRKFIKPEEGMLVIFPSYMYHQTIPHETNEDRISISFDITPSAWNL